MTYKSYSNDGWVRTFDVTNDGSKISAGRNFEYSRGTESMFHFIKVSDNIYAQVARNQNGYGYLRTFEIDNSTGFIKNKNTGKKFGVDFFILC